MLHISDFLVDAQNQIEYGIYMRYIYNKRDIFVVKNKLQNNVRGRPVLRQQGAPIGIVAGLVTLLKTKCIIIIFIIIISAGRHPLVNNPLHESMHRLPLSGHQLI